MQLDFTRSSRSGVNFGEEYSSVPMIYTFGPCARKYFSLGETVAFFGEAGLGIGAGKSRHERGNNSLESNKLSVFSAGITPGFVIRPAERIGIELAAGFFGYTSVKTENPEGNDNDYVRTSSDFGLSLDLSNVSLGVKFYL